MSPEQAAREWAERVGIPLMDDEAASLAALIRDREQAAIRRSVDAMSEITRRAVTYAAVEGEAARIAAGGEK